MKKQTKYYRVTEDIILPPFSENDYGETKDDWEYPTFIYKNSIVKELPDFFGGEDGVKVQVLHTPNMKNRGFTEGETAETERRGAYIDKNKLTLLTEDRDLTACEMLDSINNKSFEWFKELILGKDEFEDVL